MLNLETMKVEELRELAKEMNIAGAWKMKKSDLIEKITEAQLVAEEVSSYNLIPSLEVEVSEEITEEHTEEIIEEEVKPVKPRKVKDTRKVELYDSENNLVKEFENAKEGINYCLENKLANIGWIKQTLSDKNTKFYYKTETRVSAPNKKSGFTGIGWKLVYSEEV